MEPVRIVQGRAVPLPRSDVDTDQIIPSDWLKRVERTGFEKGLFSEWRDDPSFVLNEERYAGVNILIAGPNFGVGSSREHAVWALQQSGFQAVVSSRFGDIFRNNSVKCGLLPVEVSPELANRLMELADQNADLEFVIDVAARTIEVPEAGICEPFKIDETSAHRLIEGLDDIGLTLRVESQITTHESTRPPWLPSLSP